ncbi:ABC transporter permease [Cohnella candidum]|uniref:Sugar ABC transporter permease n=1 Tax=Cohnella candidum TaxID=2674991 RepID=A0A3G3K3Q0_9BACL|nr:ABC transporter permease subunit [Cohnella candidum]AYQ75136.1 sugar ABC transporter permease [Cohnella candidum]
MNRKLKNLRPFVPLYLMMLPCAIYLLINNYIPMSGIVLAFKRFRASDGMFGSPWVGLHNFTYLFHSHDLITIVRNTLLYNAAFIIVNNAVGIFLAILIVEVTAKRLKKLYQSAVLLPFTLSMVVISYVVFAFLSQEHGMLNNGILKHHPVEWYSDSTWWPLILIIVNCWKYVGYGTLIFIASIAAIDRSLFEAGAIDGAGKWKQIWHITLPSLIPTVITLFILSVGRICYSDFGLFYLIPQNSGTLFNVTSTIDTYVYSSLTSPGGIGRSAATGFMQSAVGFLLVMLANAIVRKVSAKDAIF